MLNLESQNTQIEQKVNWWRTSFLNDELKMIHDAVHNEHISEGVLTRQLERLISERINVKHVFMTPNGSIALLLAMMALEIGPGDEVIVPNRTWIATAHAALMVGAKVVLVDVESRRSVMDIRCVEDAITPRTKALIPVHLNGQAVDMPSLKRIAQQNNLFVIEDACQAFCARSNEGYLGTLSQVGCFSLGVNKLISTGQGGVAVTNDDHLAERMMYVRKHGVVDNFTDRWNQMGFNFKFNDLLASFGVAQMKTLDRRIAHIKAIYEEYKQTVDDLPGIEMLSINVSQGEIPLYAEVMTPHRQKLIEYLKNHGIQTRPVPPNINISHYIESRGAFPNSTMFAEQCLYLPSGPDQSMENIRMVNEHLKQFFQSI
jgi:dTDP-4-amino-4,6-dideoxygalactose transaminase